MANRKTAKKKQLKEQKEKKTPKKGETAFFGFWIGK